MTNQDIFEINKFFATIMLSSYFVKVDIAGNKVIALQDSPFSDTWSVFTKENAISGLTKIGNETSLNTSSFIEEIQNAKGIYSRKVIFDILKKVKSMTE